MMMSIACFPPGLSPRVRGNRLVRLVRAARLGSIPACAGEPYTGRLDGAVMKVYPRVCGGTDRGHRPGVAGEGLSPRVRGNEVMVCLAKTFVGLSPRVRGNPVVGAEQRQLAGSIPACAGEPTATFTALSR